MSIDNASPNDWYVAYRNHTEVKTLDDYIKSKQIGGDH